MVCVLLAGLNLASHEKATKNFAEVYCGPDILLSTFYGLSHSGLTTTLYMKNYDWTAFYRYRNDAQ